MNKYTWKLKGLSKGVDPNKVVKELEKVQQDYGSLTPENILDAAKIKTSILHNLFEWNNTIAANQYRLQQARSILNNIQVVVISNGEEREVDVFEVVRREDENVYKSILTFDPNDIVEVKTRVAKELNYLRNKLSFFKELESISLKIESVIDDLGR